MADECGEERVFVRSEPQTETRLKRICPASMGAALSIKKDGTRDETL
jgi:hypothetical protein